jgi:nucleoside-diphosphate-sugar epimerase
VAADREDTAALAAALGDGTDVLLDCVAYGQEHARQLTGLADRIGSAVVISSCAVYEDDQGRGFDTQEEPDGFPHYPVPIPETYRTVAPGELSYGTKKVALEQELLAAGDRLPATLLRAGAVHGRYSPMLRELYFIKRALDKRPVRVLAYNGESRFSPAHTSNIAELVRLAAHRPGSRVLNAVDPRTPTVAEIGAAVDAVLGVLVRDGARGRSPARGECRGFAVVRTAADGVRHVRGGARAGLPGGDDLRGLAAGDHRLEPGRLA